MNDNPNRPQFSFDHVLIARVTDDGKLVDAHDLRGVNDFAHGELNVETVHIVIDDCTLPTAQPRLSTVWHWSALSRRQWRFLDLLLSRLLWKRKD